MPNPNSPPNPSEWNWVDTFDRLYLGPDYTSAGAQGATINSSGQAVLLRTAPQTSGTRSGSLTLSAARWQSGDVSLQWDAAALSTDVYGTQPWTPAFGAQIHGQGKILDWDGQTLKWGGVTLAAALAPTIAPDTFSRTRITADPAQNRLQVMRDGVGLLDLALPADWASEMTGAGTITLYAFANAASISGGTLATYDLAVDNLALRAGNGTANLDTGQTGPGGPRLGSEWRFGAAPDNAVGTDGDVWANSSTGQIYQRVNGVYTLQMALVAPVGPAGPQGPQGIQGAVGPQGPAGADGSTAPIPNPIIITSTPATGFLLSIDEGGLAGYTLTGYSGPACTVERSVSGTTWTAVTYPHVLTAGETLRLTRTDASNALSVLHGLTPSHAAAPADLSVQTDADGYETLTWSAP